MLRFNRTHKNCLQANGPAVATPPPYVPVSTGYGPHPIPAYAFQAPPPAPPPAHTLSTAVDLMNTGKVPKQPMITHAPILSGNTCVRPCPDSMICALLPCAHRLQRLPHNSLGPHPELYVACRSLRMLPCMISTAVSSLQSPQSTRRQRRCALCCSNVTPSGEHPLSLVLSCCSAVLRLRLLAVLWRAILVFSVNSHPLALL